MCVRTHPLGTVGSVEEIVSTSSYYSEHKTILWEGGREGGREGEKRS